MTCNRFRLQRMKIQLAFLLTLVIFIRGPALGAPDEPENPKQLTLVSAVMCEDIQDYAPHHPAIVFSISIGRVSCFTEFDPVPEKTFIYHNWYHRDELSTRKRLFLQPPRWSTFSSIQLRDTDKGPWKVEITDSHDRILKIVRFSVVE